MGEPDARYEFSHLGRVGDWLAAVDSVTNLCDLRAQFEGSREVSRLEVDSHLHPALSFAPSMSQVY